MYIYACSWISFLFIVEFSTLSVVFLLSVALAHLDTDQGSWSSPSRGKLPREPKRNSGKVALGLLHWVQEVKQALLLSPQVRRASSFLICGEGCGGSGIGLERQFRGFAYPFVVLSVGEGGTRFLPHLWFRSQLFRNGRWFFLSFLYLLVQNLPQLHMSTVTFSPIQFLCILQLQEGCVQV